MNVVEYSCFWSGVKKLDRARAGVAIMVKRSLISRIVNFDFCNERLMALTMAMDDVLMSEKESFFEAMTNELNRVKNSLEVFIAGDFIGRVGVRNSSEVVGRHGETCQNDKGKD
jgi:hypothetical protein